MRVAPARVAPARVRTPLSPRAAYSAKASVQADVFIPIETLYLALQFGLMGLNFSAIHRKFATGVNR